MGIWLKRLSAAMAILIALLALGVVPLPLAPFSGVLAEVALEATGVAVSVAGKLQLRLGFSPALVATDIRAYVPNSENENESDRALVSIGELRVEPKLLALLRGDIHFHEIAADELDIDYCAPLPALPESTNDSSEPLPSLAVGSLSVKVARVHCGASGETVLEKVALVAWLPASDGLTLNIEGLLANWPFELYLETAGLNELLAQPRQVQVAARATLATLRANIEGNILTPFSTPEASIKIAVQAEDERWLASFAGEEAPALGSLSVVADIAATANSIVIDGLDAAVQAVPGIDAPAAVRNGQASIDLESRNGLVAALELHTLDNVLQLNAELSEAADCTQLDLQLRGAELLLQPISEALQRSPPPISLTGSIKQPVLTVSSCGADAETLAKSLQLDLATQGSVITLDGQRVPIEIKRLSAASGWDGKTSVTSDLRVLGEAVAAKLQAGNLGQIVRGIPASVDLQLSGAGAEVSLTGKVQSGRLVGLQFPEVLSLLAIDPSEDPPVLDGALQVDVPSIGSLHAWAPLNPQSDLRLGVMANIVASPDEIVVPSFLAQLGDSDLSGELNFDIASGEPRLVSSILAQLIDLQQLQSLLPPEASEDEADVVTEEEPAQVAGIDAEFSAVKLGIPATDLDIRIERVLGTPLSISAIAVTGKVVDEQIDDARVSLDIEDTVYEGLLDWDFGDNRSAVRSEVSAADIDIDQLLTALGFAPEQEIAVERIGIEMASEGTSLLQFVKNLRLDFDLRSLSFIEMGQDGQVTLDMELRKLGVNYVPDQPATWVSEGYVNQVKLAARAETPPLNDLLGDADLIPLQIALGSGEYTLMLDGTLDLSNETERRAVMRLSGQKIPGNLPAFAELEPPLAGFDATANVSFRSRDDFDAKVDLRKGTSSLQGDIQVTAPTERRMIDIVLTAPLIQTNDFVEAAEDWREARAREAAAMGMVAENADDKLESEEDEGNLLMLVDDYIDDFAGHSDLQLKLEVEELLADENRLGQGLLQLELNDSLLRIAPLRVVYPEGEASVNYSNQVGQDTLDAELDIDIQNLELAGLLPLLAPDINVGARLFIDSTFTSAAPRGEAIGDHLNGELKLLVIPDDVDASILDLWATNLVLALLPTPESGSNKVLNCMVAHFEASDGILKSKSIMLDSTDIIVRGRGTIDIPDQQLDLLVAPQAKRERFFSVSTPVRVTGPWDDFQVGLEPGGIIGTLFKWYMALIYVPFKWLTGESFPADGLETCFNQLGIDVPQGYDLAQLQEADGGAAAGE